MTELFLFEQSFRCLLQEFAWSLLGLKERPARYATVYCCAGRFARLWLLRGINKTARRLVDEWLRSPSFDIRLRVEFFTMSTLKKAVPELKRADHDVRTVFNGRGKKMQGCLCMTIGYKQFVYTHSTLRSFIHDGITGGIQMSSGPLPNCVVTRNELELTKYHAEMNKHIESRGVLFGAGKRFQDLSYISRSRTMAIGPRERHVVDDVTIVSHEGMSAVEDNELQQAIRLSLEPRLSLEEQLALFRAERESELKR